MHRHLLSGLIVLLVVTAIGSTAAADPGAGVRGDGASAVPIRVIQHNTDHVPEAWDFALAHVDRSKPDLVMIQEVCRPWFEELRAAEPGWSMAFHPRKQHFGNSRNPGCLGDFIGEAVIYTGAANRPTMTPDFPNNNDGGVEKFGMACVELVHRGIPTLGCSTHLSAYPTSGGRGTQPERGPQVQAILDVSAPYREAGYAVIVGGDFNMTSQPDNPKQSPIMDAFFGPAVGGSGVFYDATQHQCECRLTRPTTDKGNRIDYVFFDGSRTPWTTPMTTSHVDSPAGHHLLDTTGLLHRDLPAGR